MNAVASALAPLALLAAAPSAAHAGASTAPSAAPYFVCSSGKNAFVANFGPDQKVVTIDTSAHGHYALRSTPVSQGRMYSAHGVSFWTDGASARLVGTPKAYSDCHKS